MKTKLFLALLVAISLALSVTPAFAQSGKGGIDGNVCAGGSTTIESGKSVGDLLLFGCNGTVKSEANVNGDVAVFGGNLVIEKSATVQGDVAVFGGSVQMAGEVKGDIAIMGGAVNLGSTAVVNGSVRVLGGGVERDENAVVRGGITQENNARFGPSFGRIFVPGVDGLSAVGLGIVSGLIKALALAALGALLVVFFPQPTRRVVETAQGSFGPSLGVGCLTLLVMPMLFLLLLITCIGPAILAIVVAVALTFGWLAIGYLAGEKILAALKAREVTPVVAVVVGVLTLAIIGQVPCLGWLITVLIGALGLGAVVLTRFGTRPYPFILATAPVAPVLPTPLLEPTPAVIPVSTEEKPKDDTNTLGTGEPQI